MIDVEAMNARPRLCSCCAAKKAELSVLDLDYDCYKFSAEFNTLWAHSSGAERLFRIQKVGGSIPSKSTFALLNVILF